MHSLRNDNRKPALKSPADPEGLDAQTESPKVVPDVQQPATLVSPAISPPSVRQLQSMIGNQAVGRLLAERTAARADPPPVQRLVVRSNGKEAALSHVKSYIKENDLISTMSDEELEGELENEAENLGEEIGILAFLTRIGAIEDQSMDMEDDEWDPADYAADPMDPDDVLSSDVRKSLSFTSDAKKLMKLDTPTDKAGDYLCHICGKKIKQGQKVDMDHLPPWKERLHAYINANNLTTDDTDELTGPLMKHLYNMRGSVFAHASCNRGHSGEGNYKQKWGTALKWYKAGGGPPF